MHTTTKTDMSSTHTHIPHVPPSKLERHLFLLVTEVSHSRDTLPVHGLSFRNENKRPISLVVVVRIARNWNGGFYQQSLLRSLDRSLALCSLLSNLLFTLSFPLYSFSFGCLVWTGDGKTIEWVRQRMPVARCSVQIHMGQKKRVTDIKS